MFFDTKDYHSKCENLHSDTVTYKKRGPKDPTTKYKKELITVLQELEEEGGISRDEYRKLYPTKMHINKNSKWLGSKKKLRNSLTFLVVLLYHYIKASISY